MWIRIADCTSTHLPQKQQDTLDFLFFEDADQFVSIENGDWSCVREISTIPFTIEYVIENHSEEYIICENDCEAANKLRSAGFAESKGFYAGLRVFKRM